MRLCICDDEKEELNILEKLCREYLKNQELDMTVVCTQDQKVPIEEDFDLLILDIEMPKISGIDIKNALFGKERPLIIFATNYEENMKNAFGPNVIAFMKKPIEREELSFYMGKALQLLTAGKMIEFEKGNKVTSDRIMYFSTEERYTMAVFNNGTSTPLQDKSLSEWEKELKEFFFVRVSSSYLVNCKYIHRFEKDRIVLENGEKFKISRRKKSECFDMFIAYQRKYQRFA